MQNTSRQTGMVRFPFSMGTLTCKRGVAGHIMMRIQLVWLLLLLRPSCLLGCCHAAGGDERHLWQGQTVTGRGEEGERRGLPSYCSLFLARPVVCSLPFFPSPHPLSLLSPARARQKSGQHVRRFHAGIETPTRHKEWGNARQTASSQTAMQ